MAKSLDGIKKLNSQEAEKYRKIVLDYIGEKDSAEIADQAKVKPDGRVSRLMDGIKAGKIKPAPSRQAETDRLKLAIKRQAEARKQVAEEERQLAEENRLREKEKARLEKERVEQEKVERDENEKKERAEAKAQAKLAEKKRWQERVRLEEREREEKRLAEEKLRQEKIKRRAEIKRVRQELKTANRLAKEKRAIKHQKAIKEFRKKISLELSGLAFAVKKNYAYVAFFSLLFAAAAYLALCAAVLRFQLNDNPVVKPLANYLPVPAVITNQGVIGYRDYQNIKNSDYSGLTLDRKKNYLAAWLAVKNLKQKYNLPPPAPADELALKFVLDRDFNQIGLARINKIRELLLRGNQFERLGKYADEYNDGAYYGEAEAAQKFGPAVLELEAGQVSGALIRAGGYYIVERINDQNGRWAVKYVFVAAQTLEQYLNQKTTETKIFILAN